MLPHVLNLVFLLLFGLSILHLDALASQPGKLSLRRKQSLIASVGPFPTSGLWKNTNSCFAAIFLICHVNKPRQALLVIIKYIVLVHEHIIDFI